MIYCKALFASIPRRYSTLRSLSWVGTIAVKHVVGKHDPEWTAKAQHEAYTTIVGLGCLKNNHNLGSFHSVLMGNQVGQRFQIDSIRKRAQIAYDMGVSEKRTGV
jgi:hypothetical protein